MKHYSWRMSHFLRKLPPAVRSVIPENITRHCSHEPRQLHWQSNISIFVWLFFFLQVKCFRFLWLKLSFLLCLSTNLKRRKAAVPLQARGNEICSICRGLIATFWDKDGGGRSAILPTQCCFPRGSACVSFGSASVLFLMRIINRHSCLWSFIPTQCLQGRGFNGFISCILCFQGNAGLWIKPVWADHHRHRWGSPLFFSPA